MFAIAHQPKERRKSTNVHSIRTNGNEVRSNAIEFRYQDTNIFNTFRNLILNSKHAFYTHGIGMLTIHRRHVIKPVNKWDDLIIRQIFSMLFKATVEVSNMRYDFLNNFAVH